MIGRVCMSKFSFCTLQSKNAEMLLFIVGCERVTSEISETKRFQKFVGINTPYCCTKFNRPNNVYFVWFTILNLFFWHHRIIFLTRLNFFLTRRISYSIFFLTRSNLVTEVQFGNWIFVWRYNNTGRSCYDVSKRIRLL